MALNLVHLSTTLLLLFAVNPFPIVESRTEEHTEHLFTKTLQSLEGAHKGQTVKGVRELRRYLQKFGYLTNDHSNVASPLGDDDDDDIFWDDMVESALKDYQRFHHLDVTGRMDAATIERMSLPRCGVPDISHGAHRRSGLVMVADYSFFPGSPKWRDSKRALTYSFNSSVNVMSMDNVRQACQSAFQSWAKVTDFTFTESGDGQPSDIVIGFHRGDHGDGHPFDGPGQVLAHSFAPEDGRLHYDADEGWTTSPTAAYEPAGWFQWRWRRKRRERRTAPSSSVYDLETVALHEIGHLLGLGHSSEVDSIMYAAYVGLRRDLKQDDINGIRALYGTS